MRVIGMIILAALFALLAWLLFNLIPASGALASLKPKLVDACRAVKVAPGTEDVTIDTELGLAFISTADRRSENPAQGGIYTVALDGSDRVVRVSPDGLPDFQPHGVSLWRSEAGLKRLFVVNHSREKGDVVEIFDVGVGGALFHVDSISFPEMYSPNDVAAVGPRSFYVTNDRGYKEGAMAQIEAYMALPFSSLAFFDGQEGAIAVEGMTFANGVAVSEDGKFVYVSEFLRRRVTAFERNVDTNELTRRRIVGLPTGPDNIEIDEKGALWVAGHPKVFDFLKHAEDASAISPSEVWKINPATGEREIVFRDVGGKLNASSVGAARDGMLIVGAVFDDHVLICPGS